MAMPNNRQMADQLRHCSRMLRLLINSQLGYELRQTNESIRDRMLQTAVGGGKVVRIDDEPKEGEGWV